MRARHRGLDGAGGRLRRLLRRPTVGFAARIAGPEGGDAARVPYQYLPDRRSPDPVNRLSRRLDTVCTGAVDALQIAAALEAEGINDRIAAADFGRPDVFTLARELHHRVPFRAEVDGEQPASTEAAPRTGALLMRGPVYLAPALFVMAAGDVFDRPGVLWIALISLLGAWAWNQGSGALLHRRLGRKELAQANLTARRSLITGTIVVAIAILPLAVWTFDNGLLTLLAVGQTAYLISSGTLLALSRDTTLMAVLAPGALLAAVSLGVSVVPDAAIAGAAGATAAGAVAATLWHTRRIDGVRLGWPSRHELAIAGRHAGFGAAWALLIACAGVVVQPTPSPVGVVGVAAAPMVLTMGLGEWRLLVLRRRLRRCLAVMDESAAFADAARRDFLVALGTYAVSLVAATLLVPPAAERLGLPAGPASALAMAFVFLGCASFAGLALVAAGRVSLVVVATVVTLAAISGAVGLGGAGSLQPVGVFGTGCFALGVALTVAALRSLSAVVVHR